MDGIPEAVRRRMIGDSLRATFEQSFEERIDRYVEIDHHNVIPNHHFAAASAECISLYTDGYFLSAVMVTQSVAEGIRKLVVERNRLEVTAGMKAPDVLHLLADRKIVSAVCANAFRRIWKSFRDDVHHMNPKVAAIPLREIARRNIRDLSEIEKEVFAFRIDNGRLVPIDPRYWDVNEDGTVGVFLRCSP